MIWVMNKKGAKGNSIYGCLCSNITAEKVAEIFGKSIAVWR